MADAGTTNTTSIASAASTSSVASASKQRSVAIVLTSKWVNYTVTIISALLLLGMAFLIALQSPLSPWSIYYPGVESGLYVYAGSQFADGILPYRDMLAFNGPVVFLINSFAYFLGGELGIWYTELAFLAVTLLVIYAGVRSHTDPISAFIVAMSIAALLPALLNGGNQAEEYVLCFQAVGLYGFLSYFKKQKLTMPSVYIIGLSAALTLCTKPLVLLFWTPFFFIILIRVLYKEGLSTAFTRMMAILIGFFLLFVLLIPWLSLNNAMESYVNQSLFYYTDYLALISREDQANALLYYVWALPLLLTFVISILGLVRMIVVRAKLARDYKRGKLALSEGRLGEYVVEAEENKDVAVSGAKDASTGEGDVAEDDASQEANVLVHKVDEAALPATFEEEDDSSITSPHTPVIEIPTEDVPEPLQTPVVIESAHSTSSELIVQVGEDDPDSNDDAMQDTGSGDAVPAVSSGDEAVQTISNDDAAVQDTGNDASTQTTSFEDLNISDPVALVTKRLNKTDFPFGAASPLLMIANLIAAILLCIIIAIPGQETNYFLLQAVVCLVVPLAYLVQYFLRGILTKAIFRAIIGGVFVAILMAFVWVPGIIKAVDLFDEQQVASYELTQQQELVTAIEAAKLSTGQIDEPMVVFGEECWIYLEADSYSATRFAYQPFNKDLRPDLNEEFYRQIGVAGSGMDSLLMAGRKDDGLIEQYPQIGEYQLIFENDTYVLYQRINS